MCSCPCTPDARCLKHCLSLKQTAIALLARYQSEKYSSRRIIVDVSASVPWVTRDFTFLTSGSSSERGGPSRQVMLISGSHIAQRSIPNGKLWHSSGGPHEPFPWWTSSEPYLHCSPYADKSIVRTRKCWRPRSYEARLTSKSLGRKHHCTLRLSNRSSSLRHFSHRTLMLSGMGSSGSTPSRHSSCKICFPCRRRVMNPIGS